MPPGHRPPVLDQAVGRVSTGQSTVVPGFQLSAIWPKSFHGKVAAPPNLHRRAAPHPFPAGSFFAGFPTPALLPGIPLAPGRQSETLPVTRPSFPCSGLALTPWASATCSCHQQAFPHERARRKSIISALTSAVRSCWVQWPQPGRIMVRRSCGTNFAMSAMRCRTPGKLNTISRSPAM